MKDKVTIKLRDISSNCILGATSIAMNFIKDFPERVGCNAGVGYTKGGFKYYAYRTHYGTVIVTSSD